MLNGLLNLFSANTDVTSPIVNEHSFTKGFNGELQADSAVAFENDKIVLAIEYDFEEAPNHVEFDLSSQSINIVQATGDVATLARINIPLEEKELIDRTNKIVLVTGAGEDKLLQVLSLKKTGVLAARATA